MKFYEKLIILRKKALLSQEALAEKLDVTRQTISKWELGQTKPDMDKLMEISKLFDVDINVLTDDEISLEDNKKEKKIEAMKNERNNRKIILYIAIVIFIASLSTLSYRVINEKKEEYNAAKEEINKQKEEIKQEINKQTSNIEKSNFNFTFESYQGKMNGNFTEMLIDEIIKNNNKNKEYLIEVIFDNTSYGTDSDRIKKIKNSLSSSWNSSGFQEYDISLDYDEKGYVNKITIETR
ncbi:MAG: helix-turn-helix transcriptional regulator [Bacilli bacterium]|nr:helix-turn-helix transcriptional regulator [Bacilli bacterium]